MISNRSSNPIKHKTNPRSLDPTVIEEHGGGVGSESPAYPNLVTWSSYSDDERRRSAPRRRECPRRRRSGSQAAQSTSGARARRRTQGERWGTGETNETG